MISKTVDRKSSGANPPLFVEGMTFLERFSDVSQMFEEPLEILHLIKPHGFGYMASKCVEIHQKMLPPSGEKVHKALGSLPTTFTK